VPNLFGKTPRLDEAWPISMYTMKKNADHSAHYKVCRLITNDGLGIPAACLDIPPPDFGKEFHVRLFANKLWENQILLIV
jgi:hypothetical protein